MVGKRFVYLIKNYDGEQSYVMTVHSSREGAENKIERLKKFDPDERYYIQPRELYD